MKTSVLKFTLLASFAWVTLAASSGLAQSQWEHVKTEKGVRVDQKEVKDRDLPTFRGATVINANIYALLAVINDFDRHPEWMHSCKESKLLKKTGDFYLLSYNRTHAPWPVSDRDVVLESKVSLIPEKNMVRINFKGTSSPLKPEVDGVVRMMRLRGFYQLKAISANKTRVMYQVDADPGGSIPAWVAEMVVDDMPVNTLTNLRSQVKKRGGQYKAFLSRWDETQNPDAPKMIP